LIEWQHRDWITPDIWHLSRVLASRAATAQDANSVTAHFGGQLGLNHRISMKRPHNSALVLKRQLLKYGAFGFGRQVLWRSIKQQGLVSKPPSPEIALVEEPSAVAGYVCLCDDATELVVLQNGITQSPCSAKASALAARVRAGYTRIFIVNTEKRHICGIFLATSRMMKRTSSTTRLHRNCSYPLQCQVTCVAKLGPISLSALPIFVDGQPHTPRELDFQKTNRLVREMLQAANPVSVCGTSVSPLVVCSLLTHQMPEPALSADIDDSDMDMSQVSTDVDEAE
jgi:hypothetical protein